jgi:SEC-C motif-containing protein
MRSRYAAFVRGDVEHLVSTWHPDTRPTALELDPSRQWTGLDVLDRVGGGLFDTEGVVEFRAHHRDGGRPGSQHERSRFVGTRGGGYTSTGSWGSCADGDARGRCRRAHVRRRRLPPRGPPERTAYAASLTARSVARPRSGHTSAPLARRRSRWTRWWWPQNRSSPPAGKTAMTAACAMQRSQVSGEVCCGPSWISVMTLVPFVSAVGSACGSQAASAGSRRAGCCPSEGGGPTLVLARRPGRQGGGP